MPQPIEMRLVLRDLNVWTSQSVFVGPYLSDSQRKDFADNYLCLNDGFLALPLNVPGTALYKAVEARKRVFIVCFYIIFLILIFFTIGCCYIN